MHQLLVCLVLAVGLGSDFGQAPRVDVASPSGTQAAAAPRGGDFPAQLTLLARNGRVVRRVGPPGLYGEPALSPDAARVAVTLDGRIRVLDVRTGTAADITPVPSALPRPLAWAPDGRRIAFVGVQDGRFGLYTVAADGSGVATVLFQSEQGEPIVVSDWSDERFLLFQSRGVLRAWLVEQGRVVDLVKGPFFANHATLSPDGRHLAYWSDESGRGEVYVRDFDPGSASLPGQTRSHVSAGDARGPIHWGRNGRDLYYRATPGEVMVVESPGGDRFRASRPRRLFRADASSGMLAGGSISRDGELFLFGVPVPTVRRDTP